MARPLPSLLFLALGFIACEKSQVNRTKLPVEDQLLATWELRSIQNGMIPKLEYPAGNGYFLTLSGNTFKEYTKDTIYRSGTFEYMGKDSTTNAACPYNSMPAEILDRIQWTPDQGNVARFFVLDADTLTFYSGCYAYDAGSTVRWERVK